MNCFNKLIKIVFFVSINFFCIRVHAIIESTEFKVQGNIYHIEKSGRKNSKSCNLTLVNLSDNAIVYEKEIDFNGHFSFHVKRGYYLLCLADQSLNYKTLYVPIDLNSDTDLGDFILQLDIASEDPLHAFYFEQEGDIRRYILNASLRKNDIGWMLNQIIKY